MKSQHLLLKLLIMIIIRTSLSDSDGLYGTCNSSFSCGNISGLGYPFRRHQAPAYCGYPGFELNCDQQSPPTIEITNMTYRILSINSTFQILKIVRQDINESICPRNLVNTTINHELFDYNTQSYMNASLLFGCPLSFNVLGIGSIFCGNNGVGPTFLVPGIQGPGICNTSVIVPFPIQFTNTSGFINTTGSERILQEGFDVRWKVNGKNCTDCMRSGGQCMYDNVTRLTICSSPSGSKGIVWKLIVGFSCGIAGIILLLFVIICQIKRLRRAQKTANHQIEKFIRDNGIMAPKRYKYLEIKKMTNSFLEKLGQGGYGSVYKGQLPNGQLVAVKLLDDATGDGEDFINEVASISKTSQVNIVTLLGFCIEGKKRALMYEFMPNGSLDKFLQNDGPRLKWDTLFLIAKGIARGLEYLHRGCNTRIVHFDIKPHNILLDEEFVPKISDFGLAKLCRKKESIVSVMGVRGTAGYMAPEVFFTGLGGPSHKSDVYSYGMMVIEMTGARKNNNANLTSTDETYFPDLIHKRVETGDKLGVDGVITEEEDELARKMVTVSLWCIQSDPSDRPSISKVVEMLEGSFKSLQVPPRHFCWSYLPMPGQGTTSLTTQSSEGLAASKNFSS